MNKKHIENAAKETLINEPVEIQATKVGTFQRGFVAGAQWRINSVWHDDISECKDVKRRIVVEYNNGYVDVLPDIRDLDGVKDLVVRVAYVDDLLPERKEETNGGR